MAATSERKGGGARETSGRKCALTTAGHSGCTGSQQGPSRAQVWLLGLETWQHQDDLFVWSLGESKYMECGERRSGRPLSTRRQAKRCLSWSFSRQAPEGRGFKGRSTEPPMAAGWPFSPSRHSPSANFPRQKVWGSHPCWAPKHPKSAATEAKWVLSQGWVLGVDCGWLLSVSLFSSAFTELNFPSAQRFTGSCSGHQSQACWGDGVARPGRPRLFPGAHGCHLLSSHGPHMSY